MKKVMFVCIMICMLFSILSIQANQESSGEMSSLKTNNDVIDKINSFAKKSIATSDNTLKIYNVGRDYIQMIAEGKSVKEILDVPGVVIQEIYVVENNDKSTAKYFINSDQKANSFSLGLTDESEEQACFTWCKDILTLNTKASLATNGKSYSVNNVYCLWGVLSHAPLIIAYDTPQGFIYALYDKNTIIPSGFYDQDGIVKYAKGVVESWSKSGYNEDGEPMDGGYDNQSVSTDPTTGPKKLSTVIRNWAFILFPVIFIPLVLVMLLLLTRKRKRDQNCF